MQDEERFEWSGMRATIHLVLDIILVALIGSVGFIVNGIRDDLNNLKREDNLLHAEVGQIRERVPVEYVRAEQYYRDIGEIKAALAAQARTCTAR